MMSPDLVATILAREVEPAEVGKPWADVAAHLAPGDRGGWTRGGISAKAWGAHLGLRRPALSDELAAITETEMHEFYEDLYIAPFERVTEPLKGLLVDWGVLSGVHTAATMLQNVLAHKGLYLEAIDGSIGPVTIKALLNDPTPRLTYRDVLIHRFQFLAHLVALDASQVRNLEGWTARTCAFMLT